MRGKDSNSTSECKSGVLIPLWLPIEDLTNSETAVRAVVYILCLAYSFLGLDIICDKFMSSIQMITSVKREVQVKTGKEVKTVVVRVWNETVANLTLLTLGCSAPEILLSSIEIIGNDFEAGDLGPGSTLGSAAFNMFFIIGLCIFIVPSSEHRTIKHVSVFLVTAMWSIFAYFWMYVILCLNSYGEIELWEATVTFLFFPATVISAYFADRYVLIHDFLKKGYRVGRNEGVIVQTEASFESETNDHSFYNSFADEETQDFNEFRKTYVCIIRNLRKKYPHLDMPSLEIMACKQLIGCGTKSKVFKRILATKKLTTRTSFFKRLREESVTDLQDLGRVSSCTEAHNEDQGIQVCFEVGHYSIMENVGEFEVTVFCKGVSAECTVLVDFHTDDGTATAGVDYESKKGTLVFSNGEERKPIVLRIIDDDIFEDDKYFHVQLENVRTISFEYSYMACLKKRLSIIPEVCGYDNEEFEDDVGIVVDCKKTSKPDLLKNSGQHKKERRGSSAPTTPLQNHRRNDDSQFSNSFSRTQLRHSASDIKMPTEDQPDLIRQNIRLGTPSVATVLILDDDHSGIFSLTSREETVNESIGSFEVKIMRCGGAKNRIIVPYYTEEGTATPGVDYEHISGDIVFEEGELAKTVVILVKPTRSYEKDVFLNFIISDPYQQERDGLFKLSNSKIQTQYRLDGKPQLGEITRMQIRIKENREFKNHVDAILKRTNHSLKYGTELWFNQFKDSFILKEENEKLNMGKAVLRILNVPWKIFAAFVPPEEIDGGYLCFLVSIIAVGVITTIIGDIARHFGCCIGLQDSITAICLVSLGTSFPGK
ncbi:hypothetical protein QYM36_005227 [Artemia franciscana]|uniref:Calx-beta domain-containing protein n=1 Tax=Artemia franciscana TaxID=6661 RepID=A0AA88IF05_ARTSF|nr:hypothetical protein QYM36_005227 [Artemia franciscana]